MRSIQATALAAGLAFALSAGAQQPEKPPELVAPTEARTPEEERAGFRLPPGFVMQLVASEPDVDKPMNLAFDDRGRLWVTSSREYPFPAAEGAPARDRVTILEDFAPDGRARKVTQFAEDLNIPIGVLPLSCNEALVYSIPSIDRLTDTDGDGKADKREPLYSTFGFVDTHGMASAFSWGFDGWIYACHGFSNSSAVRGADGEEVAMQSGNTYRFRPDGSHVEQVTWGQVNPFGLAFDPLGNLYSCDCHSRPLYHLLRGARYPSFGKPDDGLGFGPEMMTHDHFSTGISGIAYYAADHFPADYRGSLFVGNVVTSRINRDTIEWTGASPRAIEQPDFVISDDPWFRPVDVELGPDGALYVADFYNKIIGHYEVPLTHPGRDRQRGRVWRIIYTGDDGQAPPPAMPRADWSTATVAELSSDLAHPNLAVRIRAANALARLGGPEVFEGTRKLVEDSPSADARAHAAWVLERIGSLQDRQMILAATDPDRAPRVHLQRILAERSAFDLPDRRLATAGLRDADPFVRRSAAEALGRHPASEAIRPLLDARQAAEPGDSHLVHSLRMALRDQLKSTDVWGALPSPLSERDRRDLADVAAGVPSFPAASFLLAHLRELPENDANRLRFVEHVARRGDTNTDVTLLAFARDQRPDDRGHQIALLLAYHRGTQARGAPLTDPAREWAEGLARGLLSSNDEKAIAEGLDLAGTLGLGNLRDELTAIITAADAPEDRRARACDAFVAIDPPGAIEPLGRLLADAGQPAGLRDRAAGGLSRINQDAAREKLLAAMSTVPGNLQRTIAIGLAGTKPGGQALLDAVTAGRASARVLQEPAVQIWLTRAGFDDLDARLNSLTAGLPPAAEAALALIDARRSGFGSAQPDPAKGAEVFRQQCAACHQVGGQGAKVGPQLDGVGARGLDRLLEDVLDPNRNVDQAFRTTTLSLADGRIVNGLLLREEGDILVLADSKGQEQRVPSAEVEERAIAPLSPMPANMVDQVPEADFYHLLAYLLDQKVQP